MELLSGTKVAYAPSRLPMPQLIEKEQTSNLRADNVGLNMNDVYFKNLMDYYKIDKEQFWSD
jgi:hypothetical protein